MDKINFEDGQLVSPAYLKEDGTIEEAVYEGETPLSSFNLNKMQDNMEAVSVPSRRNSRTNTIKSK